MALLLLGEILELAGRVQHYLLVELLAVPEKLEECNECTAQVRVRILGRSFKFGERLLNLSQQCDQHQHETIA